MKDFDERVWVIRNGDYSVVEVNKKDIDLFTQFFDTKEEAEEYATFLKKNEVARVKAEEAIKGKMSSKEAVKVIKNIVGTMDDYAFYTIEDKEAFRLAIEALERDTPMANQFFAPDFLCPKCGLGVAHLTVNVKYCPECGQKIIEQEPKKEKKTK